MSDDSTTAANQGSNTIRVYVYREGTDTTHVAHDTELRSVGALKTSMGLTGSISVREHGATTSVIANDATPLTDNCLVSVVGGNKTGG